MGNKAIYVCVNTVIKHDGWHIGVLQVRDDVELNEKLKIALDEHFDVDVVISGSQTIESIKYGKTVEFYAKLAERHHEKIEMFISWLY